MSLEWNGLTVSFTLSAWTVGLPIPAIHAKLTQKGYLVQQFTIEQCLRAHGKNIDVEDTPQAPSGMPWNELASNFALSAYWVGLSVLQIHAQITANGYDVNAAQIAAELVANGAQGIRVADYLG